MFTLLLFESWDWLVVCESASWGENKLVFGEGEDEVVELVLVVVVVDDCVVFELVKPKNFCAFFGKSL